MKHHLRISNSVPSFLLVSLLIYGFFPFASQARSPNIIVIVADDLDRESIQFMPETVDALVSHGTSFQQAFVASPLCIPSRASLLRGQYVSSHGLTGNSAPFKGRGLDAATTATILEGAGYRTGLIGKYFNGTVSRSPAPGWHDWHAIVSDNRYYNYSLNENGVEVQYGDDTDDYISDVITRKSVEFLLQQRTNRPFFLYLNTVAPHVPANLETNFAAPRHENAFSRMQFSFAFEQDVSDKPTWVRDFYSANTGQTLPYFDFSHQATEKAESWHRNRLRSLLAVDDMVASLMETLADQDMLDSTYIFFLSDNGDGVSRHIQTSNKLLPYEGGVRIPFFVVGPGIQRGHQLEHLISTVDVLPTIAELAAAPIPEFVDGKSLLPILTEPVQSAQEWRQFVIAELIRDTKAWPWKSTPPNYRLLRGNDFKYIEYETGEREYYDLNKDPKEELNIYGKLSPEKRDALQNTLASK